MKTMRERFDEYFEYMSGGYYASRMGRHAVHPDDIKHFIEQELKKEIVEMIEKMFKNNSDYNKGIQDIINLLNKE